MVDQIGDLDFILCRIFCDIYLIFYLFVGVPWGAQGHIRNGAEGLRSLIDLAPEENFPPPNLQRLVGQHVKVGTDDLKVNRKIIPNEDIRSVKHCTLTYCFTL